MNAKSLDIGDVSAQTGLPPSTLRYYEQIGLIRSTGTQGLRRQFDPDVLERLAFIALAQTAKFSLKELAEMMPSLSDLKVDRTRIADKVDEIETQINELTELVTLLRHIRDCPYEDQFDCPKFRAVLAASRRPPKKRQKPV